MISLGAAGASPPGLSPLFFSDEPLFGFISGVPYKNSPALFAESTMPPAIPSTLEPS